MAKAITCVCGYRFQAETDEELWDKAQSHLASAHPEIVGKVSRADILSQAEII
jgi:predicted small metal-binding protein